MSAFNSGTPRNRPPGPVGLQRVDQNFPEVASSRIWPSGHTPVEQAGRLTGSGSTETLLLHHRAALTWFCWQNVDALRGRTDRPATHVRFEAQPA